MIQIEERIYERRREIKKELVSRARKHDSSSCSRTRLRLDVGTRMLLIGCCEETSEREEFYCFYEGAKE